jgi:S-adenosylmethionine synthetase
MFGYATDETPELLPLTVLFSHKLNAAMKAARQDGCWAETTTVSTRRGLTAPLS